jgi:uncharacterized protein (DUF1684 family)
MTDKSERLAGYRHRRDHFFEDHPHSPLSAPQRAAFPGLDYFPERADLALNLALDESDSDVGEPVELPTTDGKKKSFSRAGRIRFEVGGEPVELTVLRDSDRGSLFIPSTMPTTPSARTARAGAVRYLRRRTNLR